MDTKPGHTYQTPTPEDSRSPCPALNAAANHGYLPHSGKNLTFLQLTRAVHDLYNISYPLAATLSLGGILLCGNGFSLDLIDLAKHNKVEHDASLTHQDLRDGDNLHVSPGLVDELIAESSNGTGLTLEDFARCRAKREARIPGGKLDTMHAAFAGGESVLSVVVMGNGKEVGVDAARTWFGEERLPSGWMSHTTTGLLKLIGLNRMFARMVDKAKQEAKLE